MSAENDFKTMPAEAQRSEQNREVHREVQPSQLNEERHTCVTP